MAFSDNGNHCLCRCPKKTFVVRGKTMAKQRRHSFFREKIKTMAAIVLCVEDNGKHDASINTLDKHKKYKDKTKTDEKISPLC